ncbi:hypothetical protein IWW37_004504 [Coemansia sp. RSA 2050]|nr:hypothetical protein IWW37_004504 [Coemansia sp. RSA 2050]KAJ2732214.1 hypothetical protein IW152_003997 [Coemansia sp. BCRC 34962]
MSFHYGYLQGTFGMPYGGYCVKPPRLGDITLSAENEHLRMFCVLGRFSQVAEWLENNSLTVLNQCTVRDTFTHDLIVEVYSRASFLERLLMGQDEIEVQLVIRISRTWDRRKDENSQFKPMLKALVPSGITLPEIRDVLRRAEPGVVLDTTKNKDLSNAALSRVMTRCSGMTSNPDDHFGRGGHRCLLSPSPRRGGLLLPAYEVSAEPPPEYSSDTGLHGMPG